MITLIPAVTAPVWYWTWEPIQSQPSGWGPEQAQAQDHLEQQDEPGQQLVAALARAAGGGAAGSGAGRRAGP